MAWFSPDGTEVPFLPDTGDNTVLTPEQAQELMAEILAAEEEHRAKVASGEYEDTTPVYRPEEKP